MIENVYKSKRKLITCDNCGDGFEADSWDEGQETMKQEGWKTKRKDGEWVHYCKECGGDI